MPVSRRDPFAALSNVQLSRFACTRGNPSRCQSSSKADRHFRVARGTPLSFHDLDVDAIEVTTGSRDTPAMVPVTTHFGVEARLPGIDRLMPGRLPEVSTMDHATRVVVSPRHPDHDTLNE